MRLIRRVAGALLRRIQGLTLYRRLGRRVAPKVVVHEASAADLKAVQRWLNPNANPEQGLQSTPGVTNWVAEVGGMLAGFVQLVRFPPERSPYRGHWLFSLYTRPLWQGLGIGEELSQAVIDRARQEGAPVLDLIVYEDNVRAVRLYCKLGFEVQSLPEFETQLEKEHLATGRRQIIMRKRLADHE